MNYALDNYYVQYLILKYLLSFQKIILQFSYETKTFKNWNWKS